MPKDEKLDFGVVGYSGLKQSGGVIDEEFLPKLKGTYGMQVYREMSDNSSAIGAIQFLITALVRQANWWVEPSSPDKEGEKWAQYLEECLGDMNHTFDDFVSEVLSMLAYGWSYFEVVYKLRKGDTNDPSTNSQYEDGGIGWRKIALRAQDTLEHWEFDEETGDLLGMSQVDQSSGKQAFIPISKALLFRTTTFKDNPEGRSIYRNAVIDWFFLKRICEIEAIGIERDLAGLPVMEVPISMLHRDADSNAKALLADLQKMMSELKRDEREYAIVPTEMNPKDGKPTGFKFKLLSTGGSRQIDTNGVKLYYKTNILQSVLAQFIQLGMSNVGSFALASSSTNLFSTALGSFLGIISETFNRFAVPPLMKANNVPREYWPTLVHGDVESPPLDEIGSYIQSLASAGQLPDDDALQRKLLEFADLPMPEKEEGEAVEKSRRSGGFQHRYRKQATKRGAPAFCPSCGESIPKGTARVCPSCGKPFSR